MNNITFIQGFVVSIVYLLFRFFEMRFITKNTVPLKKLVRDTLVVYISYISGIFVYTQIEPIKDLASSPVVFTNNPEF
jgi:hypothetical protein